MKVSIIGCGNIGEQLALLADGDDRLTVWSLVDRDYSKAKSLSGKLKNNKPRICSIRDAVRESEIIVETASIGAVGQIIQCAQDTGKKIKLLILSTGGLLRHNTRGVRSKIDIHIPSGAISGLDGIRAVKNSIKRLELITIKNPKALVHAPYIISNRIDLSNKYMRKLVFEGNLDEAIRGFPQNINVAATLYLNTNYPNLKIKIFADPDSKFTTHEIICEHNFGVIKTTTQNYPTGNPRTSHLAVLSAVSEFKQIVESVPEKHGDNRPVQYTNMNVYDMYDNSNSG